MTSSTFEALNKGWLFIIYAVSKDNDSDNMDDSYKNTNWGKEL